jgi:site-specific DNA-methyltransferase (adenine-specific)
MTLPPPHYADEQVTLYRGDCVDVLPAIPSGSVAAVIADPPYNIRKAAWDYRADYLAWSERWITEACRTLKPAGAFWCFHSDPLVLADLARLVEAQGYPMVSFITLDKSSWGIAKRYANAGSKTFPASAEYATYSRREVYAEQIRALRADRGLSRAEFDTIVSPSGKPTGITYRWEHGERIPQAPEVDKIRELFGVDITVPTFDNPDKLPVVWPFPQVDTTDHETPKPEAIIAKMIRATTRPGDLVLDPTSGSGTTLRVAKDLGRRAVGIELDGKFCHATAKRLAQDCLDLDGLEGAA